MFLNQDVCIHNLLFCILQYLSLSIFASHYHWCWSQLYKFLYYITVNLSNIVMAALVHARVFGLRSGNRTAAAPALPRLVRSRTPAQVQKDNDAFRISKRWPISRRSKLSRGIHRNGNECYILSSIQGLLHLPQFMNWILSHSVTDSNGNVQNPCAYNSALPRGYDTMSPNWYRRCVACAVKNLVTIYWGNYNLNRGKPIPLAATDAALIPIYSISDIMWPLVWGFREQQDADDFQARLLTACLYSTPP